MAHLRWHACRFANANGFLDRIQNVCGLVTDVRDLHASIKPRDFRHLDYFFGRREIAGYVEQASGNSKYAIEHGLLHQRAHFVPLFWRRGPVDQPHHLGADTTLARESAEIDPDWRGVEFVKIRADRQGGISVVAFQNHGDALADQIFGGRNSRNSMAGVAVNVNETGGHHEAFRVQSKAGRRSGKVPDGRDTVAGNDYLGLEPAAADTVYNFAAGDQDV